MNEYSGIAAKQATALYLLGFTPKGMRRMDKKHRDLYGIKDEYVDEVYRAMLKLDDWDVEEI